MAITMDLFVRPDESQRFKDAVKFSEARVVGKPWLAFNKTTKVTLWFPTAEHYGLFNELFYIEPVVEIDNRKWYTKYLNRIKLFFRSARTAFSDV